MSLKLSDLVGKMEKVEILEMQQSEKDGKGVVVLKCVKGDKFLDIGLFNCAEKVLSEHGSKADGKLFLEFPSAKIRDGQGVIWIKEVY